MRLRVQIPPTPLECIFCKIAQGDLPAHKVAESTNYLAMLDINPAAIGHTLIIPKKHSTNLLDLPEYGGNELLEFTHRVAHAALAATGAGGFNFVLNNGEIAGQVVFHTHFHIIPRKEHDGLRVSFGKHQNPGDLGQMCDAIKRHL